MAIDKIAGAGMNMAKGQNATQSVDQVFGEMLTSAIKDTMAAQKTAESMTMAAAQGENVPMHKIVQATSEAELTLQTMLTVRDRAVEAYQKVIQMPI